MMVMMAAVSIQMVAFPFTHLTITIDTRQSRMRMRYRIHTSLNRPSGPTIVRTVAIIRDVLGMLLKSGELAG
ncbi:hypothetical protein NG895_02285 [Aeoliella sp. ICT_H6.2]|uniref:Uncharacterized protein n=1 Tax=Aeoliella straminimaris TaxID=2954799 RepID=A0A9X2F5Q9_9BACT|nr:hypothetical protein [Aeoliella straminimaris]MCO6042725.1 hypothetical protein [Aeoliella straminimaris]